MSEVVGWLSELGLGHLRQTFERHHIDLSFVPHLTEQDLKDLGISVEDRRRLEAGIRELGSTPASLAKHDGFKEEVPTPLAATDPQVLRSVERRQLTVMFCDLVGSSALSTRLDPEDLNHLVNAYRDACVRPIERHGGFISRFVGDGILACFGYPHAHEDDAERAVWAGLGIIDALKSLKLEGRRFVDADRLAVRIGIGTGLVVVGDISGRGHLERNAIIGEAPNLAARLQSLTQPNSVVIDGATRQLAGGIFEYHDLGNQQLKGFTEPQAVWEVVGESGLENRFEALRAGDASLVGREEEMELLCDLWDRACTGQGQVAVLTGEAGIGKSHLAAAFRKHIIQNPESPIAIGFHGSPRHTNTALYPITRTLERLARFDRDETSTERRRKLVRLLERSGWSEAGEELPLFLDLLGLERHPARPLSAMPPREWHLRTLDVLKRWFMTIAERWSLLIVFEDVQWMDPSTLRLLRALIMWSANARTLILATMRTGDASDNQTDHAVEIEKSSWCQGTNVTVRELKALAGEDARRLISITARGQPLPGAMINSIIERSDGVPLYVEELTRGLSATEANSAREDTGGMQALREVPPTLNNALAARLDSVGPAREIAQVASVIGREFPSRLLSVVCPLPTEQLNSALEQLLAARIIKAVPVGRDPTYIFRHALIQNAAYRTLLRSRRSEIHLVLAQHLERDKEDNSEVADEVLAEHYARAGALRQAIVTRKRAAETAIERGAQVEAAKLLEAAIDTLAALSDDDDHRPLELELTMQLATALGAIRSYAPEVEKRYLRARDLCIELNRADLRFPVEFGLTISKFVKGDLEGADSYARELFEHASRHPSKPLVDAYLANGMIRTQQGQFEEARSLFTKGAELTRPELDPPHFTHGLNPGIYCNAYLANVLAYMGRAREAQQLIERTLAISRSRVHDPSHVYSHVSALAIAGRVYSILRDSAAVRERSEELIELARRHHYSYFESIGKLQRSWASAMQGSLESLRVGAQQMRVDLEALAQTGVRLGVQSFYVQLAEAHTRLADKVEAFANIESAMGLPDFGVRSWNAEIQRVLGEALKLAPDPDLNEALERFRTALEIARHQGAGAFEFRAALSYARILSQMDRTGEALELLGTYAVMAEPNTLDATEINQLRVELARDGTSQFH